MLGEVETREVIALKRVSYIRNHSSTQLAFYTPESEGRVIYTLYMMSDCYLGLDQQYDICLEVIPASLEAQVTLLVLFLLTCKTLQTEFSIVSPTNEFMNSIHFPLNFDQNSKSLFLQVNSEMLDGFSDLTLGNDEP